MVNFFIDVSFGTPGMCVHDVITWYDHDVWWVFGLWSVTQQPEGVMGIYTNGHVASNKENQFLMALDSPGWVLYMKNTNVKKFDSRIL
jgi:hypothetical protein